MPLLDSKKQASSLSTSPLSGPSSQYSSASSSPTSPSHPNPHKHKTRPPRPTLKLTPSVYDFHDVKMPSPTHPDSVLEKGYYWEPAQGSSLESKLSAPARAARWSIDLMRPSFFTRSRSPRRPVRPTAYLDGLRGVAALFVYWMHHQLWARAGIEIDRVFENGFGFEGKYYFACFPFIRTFFSGGHYAVCTFFVISGYVLSVKPLSLIHAGEHLKLSENVTSSLFRRWLRLNTPVLVTTFIYMSSWHLFGIYTEQVHERLYKDELWKWYCELKNFTFIFNGGNEPWITYNFHVWSIPVEFRGSIIIYTTLLALSRCTRNVRLAVEVFLIYYFIYIVDGWFCAMFMAGMLLADLDMLASHDDLPAIFSRLEPYKELIFYNLLILSLYLGGIPSHSFELSFLKQQPGWYYLSFLKPQAVFDAKWFYLFFAAVFLVASIPRIAWLRAFFEMRFPQYLGRISYSFYLVHGPVLWMLGDRLYVAVGLPVKETHIQNIPGWINRFPLSTAGPVGLELAFLLPHIILLPLTLWLAELVMKLVDEPSDRLSRWLYQKSQGPERIKL